MRKTYAILLALLAVVPVWAQHQTSRYDSTLVVMEESGLSHVIHHECIRMDDAIACRNNVSLKVDYDPLSAYVEFRYVAIHHSNGQRDVIYDVKRSHTANCTVYDYVAPARMIYWGASQKMVQVGHLDIGDELEYVTYRKGFTYALLGDDESRYIPPMRGHFYDIVPFWTTERVERRVYRLTLPDSKELRYGLYNGAESKVKVEKTHHDGTTTYTFSTTDIKPLQLEQRALAHNDIEPKLLLTTAPSWESKSVWFYGVNEDYGSFVPTAEVQNKVAEILRGVESEYDSIAALTHWVADNIRYAGISMGEGEGYTLHDAEMNFTDRCGVCKDKAGMLVAMLRAAGFEAYAAMTMARERIDDLPADQFNHSVCAVRMRDGHFQLLDPTWVPGVRELWSSAEQQQGYLLGLPQGATLQYTPLSPPENHYLRIVADSRIEADGTLDGTLTVTAEGQTDARVRALFRGAPDTWQQAVEGVLLAVAPQAEVVEATFTHPDYYLSQPVEITYHYRVPHFATIDGDRIAFIPITARNLFANAQSHLFVDTDQEVRTQPFADACSQLVEIHESIALPDSYRQLCFPQVEGVATPAASFGCRYWVDGKSMRFDETAIFGKREYEASDWPAFRQVVSNQRLLASTPVVLVK